MEIKPIKSARRNYPTLQDTLDKPELLEKNTPARWLKNGAVAGALGAFLLMGCNHEYPPDQKAVFDTINVQLDRRLVQSLKERLLKHKVSPIFLHGLGAGAIRGIPTEPPIYISEKEAVDVIKEELLKYNIELSDKDAPTFQFIWEGTTLSIFAGGFEYVIDTLDHPFTGYNKELNLAVDYVSQEDYSHLNLVVEDRYRGKERGTLAAAEIIRAEAIKKDQYNTVIFYEPLEAENNPHLEKNSLYGYEKDNLPPKERAFKKLRAQVNDFIIWAKNEGLIK